jgi:hypothetical protein
MTCSFCLWVGLSRDRSTIKSGSTLAASTTALGLDHKPTGSGPTSGSGSADSLAALDHLLSLDIALSFIHASQKSLKRTETFVAYPAPTDHHAQGTLAELFVLLLVSLEVRHVGPWFKTAKRIMVRYGPSTDFTTMDARLHDVSSSLRKMYGSRAGLRRLRRRKMCRRLDPTPGCLL